ncbi:MAG: vanomycin resistance protein VanB [Hamadaea sp.]|nr:vanomycin resistance protein VanB [Hamadaea sp.]
MAEAGVPPTPPAKRRGPIVLIAGLTAAVLAAGVAVTAYATAGDIPRGTTVLGIALGGLSRAEAAQALRDGLADDAALSTPVSVRIGDRQTQVQPGDVGLAVDVDATVAAAARSGWKLWGSRAVAPVSTVDESRLESALRPTAAKVAQAMTVPAVTFEGLTPKPVYPVSGKGLDAAVAAQAVTGHWLDGGAVEVPLADVRPATTREDVDKLVAELATPAVAAPVTLTVDGHAIEVTPQAIAKSLVLKGDATGRITPRVDVAKLRSALGTKLSSLETRPQQARIEVAGGTPKIVASTGGKVVDDAALGASLLAVLPQSTGRTVTAALTEVQAETTGQDLSELGIKERVSTFTTHFTGGLSSARSKNIVQAAKEVDGAIVKPGKTFSLNGHTGPRGYAEGYHDAPVIIDGKLVPGVGGGVSQFTTTLFNASYYAGMTDVEHKPHSYYFSRYPSVIESTIFYPSLDFKFRNDTPYGVLIDTSYTSDSITVSMWSTKYYDGVKTEYSAKRDVTEPKTVRLDPGPTCIATAGAQGFTQDAWRVTRKDGEVERQKFTWTYKAEPKYVCEKA